MNIIAGLVINAVLLVAYATHEIKEILKHSAAPVVVENEDDLGYECVPAGRVQSVLPMGAYDLPTPYDWDEFTAWVNSHE